MPILPVLPSDVNCDCYDDTTGNRTLLALRTDLMARLGYGAQAANPPPGMAMLLDSFVRGAQESLYRRYDALRTERFFSWPLTANVRLYDLPDNDDNCLNLLDPLKLTWVGVERDGVWLALEQGIDPSLYSYGVTGWVQRYEIRQCIEVWPLPEATQGRLIVKGMFGLAPMVANTDRLTIDSELVFLLALANAKAHYRQPDANNYIAQLETRLLNIVAGSHGTARYVPGRNRATAGVYVIPKPTVPFA